MPLQGSGEMSFADVYNEMTGESQTNPPISITAAEQGQLQNSNGQTIPLNQYYTPRPDGNLPTVFPTEWYLYCQRCNIPNPYLTITKSAPSSSNISTTFAYSITLTNNGTTGTNGTITITDTLPQNLSYVSSGGVFNVTINGQLITGTFNGVVNVGAQITLIIYVQSSIAGAYYNYASVSGGGENVTKTSNTTTTNVAQIYFNSSVTKRLVRTIQKNDCGAYGTGTFQEVYSPFFTGTNQSTISQADADNNANNNATALCNEWLDANGQSVANQYGTCQFNYPQMTLSKSMPGAFNLNQSGEVEIIMRTFGASTSGQIVMFDDLASGFEYVSLITKPEVFDLNIYGRSVTFTTNSSLNDGFFGQFRFLIRAITVGNYTNFASAYGGNILNNNATSNTVSTYVFSTPSFSFTRVIDNQSYYNGTGLNNNAAPTDSIYNGNVLTINNFPSTNDSKVRIEFELPVPFRVVDDVQVYYNTDYFTFSQGSAFNIVVFNQKDNVTVPIGQYGFYIFFSLPITYYRMSTVSQDENLRPEDNLVIDALNITVPRKRVTLNRNYVNNNLIESGNITTIWSNNYSFLPIFFEPLGRIPNDVNGLTYTYSVNSQANYSQPQPMGFINQQFFAYSPIYVVNPTRDTTNGVVNTSYPYYNNEFFGIVIFYRIYKDGNLIKSDLIDMNPYHLTQIDRTHNEPKYRNTTFNFLVDPNGNYIYW